MTVVLEGRWVRLEPLSLAHTEELWAAAADRSTFEWTLVPRTREDMRTYVEQALAAPADLPFATIDKARGAVVGSTRFFDVQRWRWPIGVPDPRAGAEVWDAAEIGYTWLATSAQRTGVNAEAKLLMLAHAFETRQARRVQLKTDARNQRSRAAILRLGAAFEGILRSAAPASDGSIRDSAYYSILASEWPTVKARLLSRLAG